MIAALRLPVSGGGDAAATAAASATATLAVAEDEEVEEEEEEDDEVGFDDGEPKKLAMPVGARCETPSIPPNAARIFFALMTGWSSWSVPHRK